MVNAAPSFRDLFSRLWAYVQPRRKRQFILLLGLIVAASFAEVFSIGAVIPFLGALTAPDQVFAHPLAQPLIRLFDITSPDQLLFPLTALFCIAALGSGLLRVVLLWANTRLSHATGADLSIDIYRRTLYQPYAVHVARNSSTVINGIVSKTDAVTHLMNMTLLLCGSGLMLAAILLALLSIDPLVALVSFGGFGAIYGGIIWLTRTRLARNSERIARESNQVIKSLQEGLGGIRDVLLDGSQATYCKVYRDADLPLRAAKASTLFISQSPRTLIEGLGMILVAVMAYVLAQQPDGLVGAIPMLGALVLGAQRMLPVLQQAYHAWSSIRGGLSSLQDVLELLDQPLPAEENHVPASAIPFESALSLKGLSFRYTKDGPAVLEKIDLQIKKGARVGFIGPTGSGKSTLIDIIMGLLSPDQGEFLVDGQAINEKTRRAWQSKIAHVPQMIFLADSTIEENIAFGQCPEKIDRERVRWAAEQACIDDVIDALPQQYQTSVGERGVRLSGGQRQRIGIARALYKQASVIVFDEATSALDNETEKEVMQAIEGLSQDLTVLVIAHRLSTLKDCTHIVELGQGRIVRTGSFSEIVQNT